MNTFTKKIGSVFKQRLKEEMDDVIEDEIISMVNEGQEQGVLLASEATMIQNIFEFGDKDAKDVMIHRKQMVCLDGEMTFGEALASVQAATFSRYPVYVEDLDHMIGVLHIKDLLDYVLSPEVFEKKLKDFQSLLQPVEFVPETHSLTSLFAKMQSKKNHMVIVVDEYGQTSGLISLEDILEEIVGNIQDEHDDETDSIAMLSQNMFCMTGATSLEEASEVLGIAFPEEYETLNGILISLLGKIPEEHEQFDIEYENFVFHVKDVIHRTIQQVEVECILETPSKK